MSHVPELPGPLQLPADVAAVGPPQCHPDTGTWWVNTAAGVRDLLADSAATLDYRAIGLTDADLERLSPAMSSMIPAGRDRHYDLRALVSRRFTRAAVDQLRPWIAELAADLAGTLARRGTSFDLVADYARPLATRVICRVIGLDVDRYAEIDRVLWEWLAEEHAAPSVLAINVNPRWDWWRELLAHHRELWTAGRLPDGVLADLLYAQAAGGTVEGAPLSDRDIIGTIAILANAGTDTSATGLTLVMAALLHDPHTTVYLRADPTVVPKWVAEVLDAHPPFPMVTRLLTESRTVGGYRLDAGTPVTANLTAADRDQDNPARTLAFGHGIHRCLGEHLGRAEIEVGVTALLAVPGLRLQPVTGSRTRWPAIVPAVTHLDVAVSPDGVTSP